MLLGPGRSSGIAHSAPICHDFGADFWRQNLTEGVALVTGVEADARLALSAAVQRVARWSGAEMVTRSNGKADSVMVPTPTAALAIARQLELSARAEVIAAIRRLRGEGRSWQAIASLLGFDSLPDGGVADPARLAFDYAAGLPRPPAFAPAQLAWVCPECAEVVGDTGPAGSPWKSQRGHRYGCKRLAAEVEAWDGQSAAEMRDEGT